MKDQPNTFEDSLTSLESIVARLERGDGDLSTALAGYEQGVKLLMRCQEMLEAAEKSVALLTGVDEQGNPIVAPFDAAATSTSTEAKPRRPI